MPPQLVPAAGCAVRLSEPDRAVESESKYLFLEMVAQISEKQCKVYPTSFVVIRDTVLRFRAECVSTGLERRGLGEQRDHPRQFSHGKGVWDTGSFGCSYVVGI